MQIPKPVLNPAPKKSASASSVSLDELLSDSKPSQLSGKFDLSIDNAQSQPNDLATIHARVKEKARRQTIYTTITVAVLSIATVILGVVIYRQLNQPADQTAGQTVPADTAKPTADNAASSPTLLDLQPEDSLDNLDDPEPEEPDEDDQPIEQPRVLAADLPEREFEYLKKKEMRSVWQRIRPRLVSLAIRTDLGAEQTVGTIIDSRGWALTSNQLVSKWPDVTATASARNIDAYYADVDARKQSADSPSVQPLLTDVSKGIASAQPKRDQALLALNTRFVLSLDKFEFADIVVAGSYLVQVAPPSPTNPYGFEEVKVLGRQEFDELETEARDKATALGIDDSLTDWVVTTKKASPALGTPVFTRTGEMVGTFAFSTKQFAYFVPSDRTPGLIAQAAQSGADKGVLTQVDVATELLSPSHQMARPSELLNRAGVACEAFNWIPDDADQYKQLQKFSRRFVTVAKFIQDNQNDESDSVSLSILSDQIKRWQRSLSRNIRDSLKQAPEKIRYLNAIAIDKLSARRPNTANTYIPFVAEIYSRQRDENDRDWLLMSIDEELAIVKVPFSQSGRMRPGSQWLCFYRRPSRSKSKTVQLQSGQYSLLFEDGNILRALGPIEKR